MNEHDSGTRDFKADYALLELHHRADWHTVRTKYRQLVHLWHPDRYTSRPRERAHAQKNFIALTKAYTHLKSFHRQHGRLPFESIKARTPGKIMATRTPASRHDKKTLDHRMGHKATSCIDFPDTTIDDIEPGILGRDSAAGDLEKSKKGLLVRTIWIIVVGAVMLATLIVFFVLDHKTQQQTIERGREVVRDAPQSDFMPSASEIRRSEAKGAFVQPTD